MRKSSLTLSLLFVAILSSAPSARIHERPAVSQTRGPVDFNRDEELTGDSLYDESHALIIGIEKYQHLDSLPGVGKDVPEVVKALEQHGFTVEVARKEDMVSERLPLLIKDFLNRQGPNPESRLLIYYAGHGFKYTDDNGKVLGLILPSDTPRLGPDSTTVRSKAIGMENLLAPAKAVKAKHVLFIFDSCYSGSLINVADDGPAPPFGVSPQAIAPEAVSNASPHVPQIIRTKVSKRAHQIIASGTDKQAVPDDSEFRRKFVTGLTEESGQGADYDGDSYVTASELGKYLEDNVTNTSKGSQQPIWGSVGSKAANPGDFVFALPGATAKEVLIGPVIDPELWSMPPGWFFEKNAILANSQGQMLPRLMVRHSFRDFQFVTRLMLQNNTAAGLILRAQSPKDFYLLRLTGGAFPNKSERFHLRAWVVRQGRILTELTGSPLPVNDRELVKTINYKNALQVQIIAEGNSFTVHLQSGEGNERGLPLLAPVRFLDKEKTLRYGAPGFLTEEGEKLQILSAHVYKLTKKEKGGI